MTRNAEQPTSGIAVLATDSPDWDDGPFEVQGVALPEDIQTNGNAQNETIHWPSDIVESAAREFDGAKIVDPTEHDPQTAIENPQPSPDTILGEITAAKYEPGTGVVYEGEIDDPEIAKRVERGRVEVSPTIFREVGEGEPKPVTDVRGVRDLSVVAEGQADGNKIEPATAAMSTLSAEALHSIFAETMADISDLSEGTLVSWGSSGDRRAYGEIQEIREEGDNNLNSEIDGDQNITPPAALITVHTPGSDGWEETETQVGHKPDTLSVIDELPDPSNLSEESDGETMGAESPTEDDDGTDANQSPSDAETLDQTMSNNDISDSEEALLEAVNDPENAAEVLKDYQSHEEPEIVEQNKIETLEARVGDIATLADNRLMEDKGLSEATVEAMSLEAKLAEFSNEDGNLEAESLIQTPETGTTEGNPDNGEAVETLVEELGVSDKDEAVATLKEQHERYTRANWETQAEDVASRLETLGVEV